MGPFNVYIFIPVRTRNSRTFNYFFIHCENIPRKMNNFPLTTIRQFILDRTIIATWIPFNNFSRWTDYHPCLFYFHWFIFLHTIHALHISYTLSKQCDIFTIAIVACTFSFVSVCVCVCTKIAVLLLNIEQHNSTLLLRIIKPLGFTTGNILTSSVKQDNRIGYILYFGKSLKKKTIGINEWMHKTKMRFICFWLFAIVYMKQRVIES